MGMGDVARVARSVAWMAAQRAVDATAMAVALTGGAAIMRVA